MDTTGFVGQNHNRANFFDTAITALPPDIIRELFYSAIMLLEKIYDLCRYKGRHSKTGAEYCFPAQKTFGKMFGFSREQMNRAAGVLAEKGLIVKIRRRKEHGRWMTNLYKIGPKLLEILKMLNRKRCPRFHHVTSSAHIVSTNKDSYSYKEASPLLFPNGEAGEPLKWSKPPRQTDTETNRPASPEIVSLFTNLMKLQAEKNKKGSE